VGSGTQEAHFATLRHNLPASGVEVLLDLGEAVAYAGLKSADFTMFEAQPCAIEPEDVRDSLDEYQRRVVQLLCMHWTRARLRPLGGGYSGSALYIADGWKGDARTEPMVLKIDAFAQMRRELDGYHQVKDFFGKHVPTFGYPVHESDVIGVGMELAAMEGRPETLQDTFEVAEDDESANHFLFRFDKALDLLASKLYGNTLESSWVVPYRVFALHTEKQVSYLQKNTEVILQYLDEAGSNADRVNVDQLVKIAKLIAANPDGVKSEVCLVHGDLNYQNVICDAGENVWFIDWTHSGTMPVELDFAKLENDVKFVLTKTFELDDMERLKRFEEYLLTQRIPGDVDSLPDSLKFAKWDLRFRKILHAVRRIRQTLFDLKEGDSWLVYRIALLRYSTQTLSFDKRRERGECDFPQLLYALYSSEALLLNLVADDFHLKIRAERPAEYPERQRISIDEAPWVLDCESYDPPYFVAESVLENDRLRVEGGWADPEDVEPIKDELLAREAKRRDDLGRPLNPRGRTGVAGRGLLGLWGSNLSVAVTAVRKNAVSGQLDVLLGNQEDEDELGLPKGFVLPSEGSEDAVTRVIGLETGWKSCELSRTMVSDGYTYDPRQTDHAWVESRCYLLDASDNGVPDSFEPGGEFDEVKWWPLDAAVVNRVPPGQAHFIRQSVTRLVELDRMTTTDGEALLAGTG
jgi:ADP-ribose pyrophosphatase